MCKCYLALCLVSGALWGQPSRDQGRRADLDFISTQLPKLQINFFSQLSPSDYNKAVTALDAQVPTLTDAEFYIGLARLAAMAGDDHTYVRVDDAAAVSAGFQQFPLQFRWLDDGLFVTAAASEYSRALGTKLVRAGNISIDDVMQGMGTIYPHFNSQRLHFVASALRFQQILQGLDMVPPTPTTPLTFQTLAGDQFTLDVSTASEPLISAPAADQGTLPPYLQNTNQNYWFTYSAANRLLYFKYNKCTDDPANPFAGVVNNFLNTFDANPVDTLVIDLRGNNGGDPALLNSLTDGLILRIPAFLKNPNLRIYVPIDKGTFSGASDDAMVFKTPTSEYGVPVPSAFDPNQFIRVIGEPTSEAPAHAATTAPFTLPYSKLDGEYAIAFSAAPPFIAADYDTDGPSFGPDIAVPTRSTDYFARHDPVLAAILARFEGAPPAPTGAALAVNGASLHFEQGLAPGSLASVLGSFPAGVDGVQVNGQDGQVLAATESQVDFVIPAAVSPGPATISVRSGSSEVAAGQATITAAGPGIFVQQTTDPSQPGMVFNEDSNVNGSSARAAAGSVLQISATGYGPLDSSQTADVQVFLGGVPATVLSSGPGQLPGLWQIDARVPDGLSGQVPLFIIAGNIASNGVTVWVQ
jgi:uncharacterized protein (TIGR03437 family)